MKTKTTQNGRSMIEMLGVLAIIGVLSVGGIAGYSKAMQKYRTNKTIDMVSQLANGIRTLYAGRNNYNGLSAQVVYKAKILSGLDSADVASSYVGAESYQITASNPFGGDIVVSTGNPAWGFDNKSFVISLTDIPEDACIEILSQDWGDSSGLIAYGATNHLMHAGLLEHIHVSRTSCRSNNNTQCAKDGQMTVSKAMSSCSNSVNFIYWKFY
ncbi:MAG: hypothetical protein IJ852_00035 [Alphaproteobacteria bacterium]|nr:hypothetical protein [Alphaproteobacteria bacterium]